MKLVLLSLILVPALAAAQERPCPGGACEIADLIPIRVNEQHGVPILLSNITGQQDGRGRLLSLGMRLWGQDFRIRLEDLQNGPQSMKYGVFEVLSMDNLSLNENGEGSVRIRLNPRFVAPGAKGEFDVKLARTGPEKTWVALVDKKIVKTLELQLTENPFTAPAYRLLASPPQVAQVKFETLDCGVEGILEAVKLYKSLSYPKSIGCRPKWKADDLVASVDSLSWDVGVNAYTSKSDPASIEKKMQASASLLQEFRTLGMDLSSLSRLPYTDVDPLYRPVQRGNLPLLDLLMKAGFQPKGADAYGMALTNVYQAHPSYGVVVSPLGKTIFEKVKAANPEKGNMTNILENFFSTEDQHTAVALKSSRPDLYYQYVYKLCELLRKEGWDPGQRGDVLETRLDGYQVIKREFSGHERAELWALLHRPNAESAPDAPSGQAPEGSPVSERAQ